MITLSFKKIFYNNFSFGLGLLSLSLGVFSLFGYSFSIANFLVFYLFFYYLNKNSKIIFAFYFSLVTYFLFIAVLFINNLDFIEYIKSFLLTSIMLLVFLSSLAKPIHSFSFNLSKIISYISVFIVFFEIVQISEYLIAGTSNTWFLLDRFSISTATDVGRFQAVNFLSFMRPISFYHEPSYLGIVLLILLICASELRVKRIFILILYFGIVISFSTTALFFLVSYIFLKNLNNIKNIVFILFVILILMIFIIDEDTLNNVFRFSEILNSGTSGHERLIGPYDYLIDQIFIRQHYLGIPLGQSDLIFNNSFYLLFLYFGFLTPLLLISLSLFVFVKFKSHAFKYLIAFFALLFLNGAIFTLESALILYCLNYTFMFNRYNSLATEI